MLCSTPMLRATLGLATLLLAGLLIPSEASAQSRQSALPDIRPQRSAPAPSEAFDAHRGGLTFYATRTECTNAHPGLPTEDFSEANLTSGSSGSIASPLDASTNNALFQPGDILPGLSVEAVGPFSGSPDALFVIKDGVHSGVFVGSNFAEDDTRLAFDPGVTAVCVDYYNPLGASNTLDIEVYDTGGNLLGVSSPTPSSARSFFGVASAGAAIGAVLFVQPKAGGNWTNVSNVSFGGSAGCVLNFSATLNSTTVSPGGTLVFNVTVQNTSGSPVPASLQLVATGPVNRTLNLGSGTVPGGATVNRTINVRVPGNAPSGTYILDLNLLASGQPCDTERFTVQVTAPRVGNEVGAAEFELVGDGFFAEASAVTGVLGVAPNPFVGQSAITFEVAEAAQARLAVYDVLGRQVAVLVDGPVEAGTYTATFDARGLSAGTYVYRLVVGSEVQTGRMTLAH